MLIEELSYQNSFNKYSPIIKIIFALVLIFITTMTNKILVFLLNLLISNIFMYYGLKISLKNIFKLYLIPMIFVAFTLLTLLLVGVNIKIFLLRILANLSIMYSLICSTPIVEFDYFFYKLKFPSIFRELFLIIYKYIFIFIKLKNEIINSQKSRLGDINYKQKIKSFILLVVSIFEKIRYYAYNTSNSIESRNGINYLFSHKKYENIPIKYNIYMGIILLLNVIIILNKGIK